MANQSSAGSAASLDWLKARHAGEAHINPSHVHVSWFTRALLDESISVQCTVLGSLPVELRERIARGLGTELLRESPAYIPDPVARALVLAFWKERLVAGPPADRFDTPVVHVLSQYEPGAFRLLCGVLAMSKLLCAHSSAVSRELVSSMLTHLAPGTLDHWRGVSLACAEVSPEQRAQASADLNRSRRRDGTFDARALAFTSIGHLLSVVEPFRLRWTLQHVPYPLAKHLRRWIGVRSALMGEGALLEWEYALLRMAIDAAGIEVSRFDSISTQELISPFSDSRNEPADGEAP